ncbi:hypothetical protein KO529_21965 [Arenibacter algicola]|uniref:ABC-three component system protein n=1 Tax=Arenibacter algicola TaxID=616991 RepID=UPI001C072E4D|nr:ABC-three component system protein [Arenibacter algicola]MBU2907483.1 hypothetical protein [Arenibacter algicola]
MAIFVDPNTIHSAIDTWSGFIYQGKVSLYHVLDLLNKDKNSNTHFLQLDSLEDFAVLDGDEDLISLHQVKAVNNRTYNRYREDFEKLEQRRATYPCSGAFFHVAKENERDNVALQANHPNIEFYEYSNGNLYCELNEIETLIDELISIFLNVNNLQHWNNAVNIEIIRSKLEGIIFTQVVSIHAINHQQNGLRISEAAFYCTIPFQSFINVLKSNPENALNDDYYLETAKIMINDWFMEFGDELQEQGLMVSENDKLKMQKYLVEINALSTNKLLKLLKNITPQRNVEFNNLKQFNESLQKSDFQWSFIQGLFDLISCANAMEKPVWSCDSGKKNALTGINDPISQVRRIARSIKKNILNNDVELPYEIDRLITSELEVESLKDAWNNQNNSPEDPNEGKNNVTKWGDIELVMLRNIKDSIK